MTKTVHDYITETNCVEINNVNASSDALHRYADEDPAVAEFIMHVLDTTSDVGSILRTFMSQLGFGINLNQLSNTTALTTICFFVSNFFNDDSYFVIEKVHGCNQVRHDCDDDNDFSQSAQRLIDAAKENIAFYKNEERLISEWVAICDKHFEDKMNSSHTS